MSFTKESEWVFGLPYFWA